MVTAEGFRPLYSALLVLRRLHMPTLRAAAVRPFPFQLTARRLPLDDTGAGRVQVSLCTLARRFPLDPDEPGAANSTVSGAWFDPFFAFRILSARRG